MEFTNIFYSLSQFLKFIDCSLQKSLEFNFFQILQENFSSGIERFCKQQLQKRTIYNIFDR